MKLLLILFALAPMFAHADWLQDKLTGLVDAPLEVRENTVGSFCHDLYARPILVHRMGWGMHIWSHELNDLDYSEKYAILWYEDDLPLMDCERHLSDLEHLVNEGRERTKAFHRWHGLPPFAKRAVAAEVTREVYAKWSETLPVGLGDALIIKWLMLAGRSEAAMRQAQAAVQ